MAAYEDSVELNFAVKMEATGRVIANFAWQHLKAATTFRDQVISIELQNTGMPFGTYFEDIRSYGTACIMSAAGSLESLINEFFIWPEGPLRQGLQDFESEFWGHKGIEWKPPLQKYQKALEMLGQPKFDERVTTFRDVWALIELRNYLVHYKPTWDPDRQRRVELVEVLTGKYKLSPFPDNGSDFVTMQSMSSGCMKWVVSTVLSFMRAFHERVQLDENKMSGFWRLET